ncbi:unannotated protein [freshwater metagenome]|uniref:Unannotated protein n=1 Tax=freshwater metagenome TaxID=449393 RepID=A0A6J7HAM5_9ZZZZ
MSSLRRNAELPEFLFAVVHARKDALRNRAEVVIVELLTLRGFGAKEGASRSDQIRTSKEEAFVD